MADKMPGRAAQTASILIDEDVAIEAARCLR
jgi:hypothetical protein